MITPMVGLVSVGDPNKFYGRTSQNGVAHTVLLGGMCSPGERGLRGGVGGGWLWECLRGGVALVSLLPLAALKLPQEGFISVKWKVGKERTVGSSLATPEPSFNLTSLESPLPVQ